MIDGSLVFGTPLVAFGLQAALLEGARLPLAFCALGLGLLYTLLAALLRRRPSLRPLGEAHAVLAVGLATLAVPLALSARVSASVFAVEGAALIWLGLRQHRLLPQLTGAGLQLLAGVVLILSLPFQRPETLALANPTFMAGALIAASGLASAWCLRHRGLSRWALGAYLWGLAWWLGTALQEIGRFAPSHLADDWRLALLALTGALIAEFHRRHPAPALAWSLAAGLLATLPLLAAPLVAPHSSPVTLSQLAPWGWALVVILGDRQLRVLRLTAVGAPHHREPGAWAQGAWLWALALFLTGALLAALPPPLGEGWRLAAALLPWLGLLALLLRPPLLLAAMLPRAEAWRPALAASLALALAALWLLLLGRPGSPAPLAWWPLLNPLFLAQGASLLVLWRLQRDPICPARLQERGVLALALAAFALLSLEVLRGAHLLGLGPWSPSLLEHQAVQTALTLLWSVLGVSGWILGSRRRLREVWLVSALLMAVVLAKLVLVDRTHLGNLLGIVSFIGYGLLCIAVGYIAPAPRARHGSRRPRRRPHDLTPFDLPALAGSAALLDAPGAGRRPGHRLAAGLADHRRCRGAGLSTDPPAGGLCHPAHPRPGGSPGVRQPRSGGAHPVASEPAGGGRGGATPGRPLVPAAPACEQRGALGADRRDRPRRAAAPGGEPRRSTRE